MVNQAVSIYDPRFANELGSFVEGILTKISKEHGIKYNKLLNTVLGEHINTDSYSSDDSENDDDDELEIISQNGIMYMYCVRTRNVYSYKGAPTYLGKMDENMNIVPVLKLKPRKTKAKLPCVNGD